MPLLRTVQSQTKKYTGAVPQFDSPAQDMSPNTPHQIFSHTLSILIVRHKPSSMNTHFFISRRKRNGQRRSGEVQLSHATVNRPQRSQHIMVQFAYNVLKSTPTRRRARTFESRRERRSRLLSDKESRLVQHSCDTWKLIAGPDYHLQLRRA